MKYNDWKLLTESIGNGLTLGLSQPNVIGGPIGSQLSEKNCSDPDSDEEEEEDKEDSEEAEAKEDEDSEEMEAKEDEVDSEKTEKKYMSKEKDDMSFLNDIDPALMGDEEYGMNQNDSDELSDESDVDSDELGDEEAIGPDELGDESDVDSEELGDEDAIGPDELGDESDVDSEELGDEEAMGPEELGHDDKHKDTMELMKMMASYCGKYMKAESVFDENHHKMKKAKCSDKKQKKHCNCESDDFLNSLSKQTQRKGTKPISEDALFTKVDTNTEEETNPGDVGFAPQGRIGSIGGGYTKDDFADIPVLGESHKFTTLTEWAANRSKK
jgi:hypothetical protein